MKDKIRVTVVGGSASAAFALKDSSHSWPQILARSLHQAEITHIHQNSLTFIRSVSLIDKLDSTKLLILHYGTSVAWPTSLINVGHKLGLNIHNEVSFHQPPHLYGGSHLIKARKVMKLRLRNALKYLLFLIGLYKPKLSFREIEDQVEAVIALASERAEKILWIQHKSLQSRRILLERLVYERYYRRVIEVLSRRSSSSFYVLPLKEDFQKEVNYLADGVHLSEQGHRELAGRVLAYIIGNGLIA